MTNSGEDISLQYGEPVGNFVRQSRQPGKGASGQKGAPGSSWAHLVVLGQLAFGLGLVRALVLGRLAGGFEIRAHGTHNLAFGISSCKFLTVSGNQCHEFQFIFISLSTLNLSSTIL